MAEVLGAAGRRDGTRLGDLVCLLQKKQSDGSPKRTAALLSNQNLMMAAIPIRQAATLRPEIAPSPNKNARFTGRSLRWSRISFGAKLLLRRGENVVPCPNSSEI
jgi:hypothetical protein